MAFELLDENGDIASLIGMPVLVNRLKTHNFDDRKLVDVPGVVKYVGYIKKQEGKFVGIELTEPWGNTDGCLDGERYFVAKKVPTTFQLRSPVNLLIVSTFFKLILLFFFN